MYRRRQQGQMFHHGRIAIENTVIGKVDELIVFVENRYPKNIFGSKFNLGSITNNRLW